MDTDRLSVLAPGPLTTVQDLGRLGHAHLGVSPSPRRCARVPLGAPLTPPRVPVELAISRVPVGSATVRFRWGPRHELFDAADRELFATNRWRASTESNRVGVRLSGTPLRIGKVRLASEGMVRGAIQVPSSGEPIVLLADYPVTGGYPVIGVVTERDLGLVAQSPPGTEISFQPFLD